MRHLFILFIGIVSLNCVSTDSATELEGPQLLLISFDGFRADYLSKTDTPNFDSLVEEGVVSDGLIPIFPTKTFPNHYTIVTGLYPENSGLVGNNMYDPEMDAYYRISDREAVENPDWYWGEPIWNTVEKAGKRAGTMFWVGSEAPVQGMRPTYWEYYDGSMSEELRIDRVLGWMTDSSKAVNLGTLYFSFLDDAGHGYGPDSEEVVEAIKRADSLVGYLLHKLKAVDPERKINMMIVSDHGMTALSRERIVVLDDYVDVNDLELISYSPVLKFNVAEGKEEAVYQALKANEQDGFKIYKKEDIPERYHLKNNRRVQDFLMEAAEGYTINTKEYFDRRPDYPSGGTHGFDNANTEMHAVFIAHGPAFKNGLRIEPIENIHLYELMAKILEVEPAPNDGSLEAVESVLK